MIIIDYNAIAIANIVVQKIEINEEMIRHMILNSIRMYNVKFRKQYGQMVIANDSSNWRREIFPQYKFKRRDNREESPLDWTEIFRIINKIFDDLGEHFPYKTVRVQRCEADDVIAALVDHTQEFGNSEDVMIVSSDKDFIQLHRYNNVRQFSPMTKKFIQDKNPRRYLFDQILKGDSTDGVPNIFSPDNTFVDKIRQTPMTQKKMDMFFENADKLQDVMDSEVYRNYCRNKKMVDLGEAPVELKLEIIDMYTNHKTAHRTKVLNYLIKNRCRLLIECAEEFS
jgi:5'-3' exonuclease